RALELVVFHGAGRDAAAVVEHRHRVVGVDGEHDFVAVAGERLVHCVVDDFEHHVVQAGAIGGVADVHPGALAHRLEALQDLDAVGFVAPTRLRRFLHWGGRVLLRFTHSQILIGMTTYLKSASDAKLSSALEAASPNLHSTSLPVTLFSTSSR